MKKTILIIILLFSSLAHGQFWENPNQKPSLFGMRINRGHLLGDPVGLWLMSERFGNKVFDLSGNRNDGTFVGTPTWVPGKFGTALDFDGSGDYFILANTITLTGEFTIGFWFNSDDLTTRTILGTYDSDEDYLFLTDVSHIQLVLGSSGKNFAVPNMSTGTWYFVVFTRDSGNDIRCYFNGVESSTGVLNSAISFSINAIGKAHTGAFDYDGRLDLPFVYNRALSASEIAQVYRESFSFMEPNWDMELYGWMTAPALGAGQFIFINMN